MEGFKGIFLKIFFVVISFGLIFMSGSCPYQKMKPPPDVDKVPPPAFEDDMSCWMAAAANMLAGAGYGNGDTVQQRADDIYADMVANYTKLNRGWPQWALQWWLSSTHNTWTNNPYTQVDLHGHTEMTPWNDTDVPQFLGNKLRDCSFISVCFSWPVAGPTVGAGGHATTDWGDNFGKDPLTLNPTEIRMTDSDRDGGGAIQVYNWDSRTNPNPGGPNEGNGWYFDYGTLHPYLRCAVELTATDDITDSTQTQRVVGSFKIHQNRQTSAVDLHYKVGTDVTILSYLTRNDWFNRPDPDITEGQPDRKYITVDWDFSEKPVPYCTDVTITTDFILPYWNAISYTDVYFTYPKELRIELEYLPSVHWELQTPKLPRIPTQDVTGGYVIGAFDIESAEASPRERVVAEYRFIHQYNFNQAPEQHQFILRGDRGFVAANLRFGHSYGLLKKDKLWKFEKWMTKVEGRFDMSERSEIKIDWTGKLPYPKGMDVREVLKYIQQKK